MRVHPIVFDLATPLLPVCTRPVYTGSVHRAKSKGRLVQRFSGILAAQPACLPACLPRRLYVLLLSVVFLTVLMENQFSQKILDRS